MQNQAQIVQNMLLSDIILPKLRGFMMFSSAKSNEIFVYQIKTVSTVRVECAAIFTNFWQYYPYAITPVTMAVKSHLRGGKPVVINPATNDALSGSAKNIGALMNLRNYYFVPLLQDDCIKKPTSVVGNFELIPDTVERALRNQQIQPFFMEK